MRVAIIDDGVFVKAVNNKILCYAVRNGQVVSADTGVSKYSHGTTCAKLVERTLSDVELISISIYGENQCGKEKDLEVALDWCTKNRIDLINMSNGAYGYFDNFKLNDLCFQNYNNGTYLVAAVNINMIYTVPAHLPYVISVSNSRNCLFRKGIIINSDANYNGLAMYSTIDGKKRIGNHTSFSCARVSNRILRYCNRRRKKGGFFKNIGISNRLFLYDFELLKNMVCLSNDTLIRMFGYSPCSDYYSQGTFEGKTNSIVCLSSDNIDVLIELIHNNYHRIFSIIWCDNTIPKRLKELCKSRDIKYWDKTIYDLDVSNNTEKIAEPIIVIKESDISFKFATKIKERLSLDEYNALLFSEKKYSFLYGAIMTTSLDRINMYCGELNPDLVIVVSNSDELSMHADIMIYFDENVCCIKTETGVETYTTDFENIYKKIILKFEEN